MIIAGLGIDRVAKVQTYVGCRCTGRMAGKVTGLYLASYKRASVAVDQSRSAIDTLAGQPQVFNTSHPCTTHRRQSSRTIIVSCDHSKWESSGCADIKDPFGFLCKHCVLCKDFSWPKPKRG